MKLVVIHNAQQYPYHFRQCFEEWLFQGMAHLQSQAQGIDFDTFLWINEEQQTIQARLTLFYCSENRAVSSLRATFGGLNCAEDLPLESIEQFVQAIQQTVRRNIQITPNYWEKSHLRIKTALQNCGFGQIQTEINQYLEVNGQSFEEKVHHSLRRNVRKCEALGLIFEQGSMADLPDFYQLLLQARQRKGFPVSLNLVQIQALFQAFPQHFQLFLVKKLGETQAATIVVQMSEQVLYYFLPADIALPYSPMSFLLKNLYEYAQNQGFTTIDLGVSSVGGVLNQGLFTFKNRCGATVNEKTTYEKTAIFPPAG